MAKGDPLTSPYVWEALDYALQVIRITVTFNNATRAITGITVFRDPLCQYTKILIGTGADGTPDSTTRSVSVPAGTSVLSQGQLNALAGNGISTIENVLSLQITAGR